MGFDSPSQHQYVKNEVWDVMGMAWTAMTQPVVSTDTLNVTGTFTSTESNYAQAIYEDGDALYICKAATGSSLSSAVWQIHVTDLGAVPMQTLWCDGNDLFDNTATDLSTVRSHSYI